MANNAAIPLALAILVMTAISCRHAPPPHTPATRLSSEEIQALRGTQKSIIKENAPTLVAAGPLPLLHIFDLGGSIRILGAPAQQYLADPAIQTRHTART